MNIIENYIPGVKRIIIESSNIIGSYILWIFVHYIATQLYVKLCVHWSIIGFITSPLLVAAPHCSGLLWCINQGVRNIQTMWVIIGYWLIKCINPFVLNEDKKNK